MERNISNLADWIASKAPTFGRSSAATLGVVAIIAATSLTSPAKALNENKVTPFQTCDDAFNGCVLRHKPHIEICEILRDFAKKDNGVYNGYDAQTVIAAKFGWASPNIGACQP